MPSPKRVIAAVLGGMVASACASGASHTRFVERDSAGIVLTENEARGAAPVLWRAEEQVSIGAAEGATEALFGYVAHVTVDGAGRIYALDQQANEVRVFDGAGRFLRKIGRPGALFAVGARARHA